jgi:quercetin 2,3-dioxygenase
MYQLNKQLPVFLNIPTGRYDSSNELAFAPKAQTLIMEQMCRGFETCSIMMEGQMEHRDSAGNKVSRCMQGACAGCFQQHARHFLVAPPAANVSLLQGVIGPGGVQWMTAGRGIIHSEMPRSTDGKIHGFQLWINLPAKDKMVKPRYVQAA